jgi:quercetin dioxygenase-like cupin family protein
MTIDPPIRIAFSRTRVVPWGSPTPPDEDTLHAYLVDESLSPVRWSAEAYDAFPAHAHSFDKVLYVVSGELLIGLPQEGGQVRLRTGDRLELPAYTIHDAVVGPAGVVCLEAHHTIGCK